MSQKFLNPVEVNGQVSAEYLDLSTTTTHVVNAGEIAWNSVDGTFDIGLLNGVTLQAGQEMHFYGKATEAISNGNAVMFAGVQGDHILIAKADAATINANPEYFMGVATQDFTTNEFGYVTAFGNVRGLNTVGYTLGSVLYYDSTTSTDGLLTSTEPSAPNAKILVAAVVRVHATQGILMVRPHTMPQLKDIQDVNISLSKTTPIDADSLLLQDSANSNIWKKLSWSNTKATLKTYFDTIYQSVLTNPVTGAGTTNYVPKFTETSAIGNSNVYDDGTNVGIGTSSPGFPLEVNGAIVSKGGGIGGLDGTIGLGSTGTSLSGNAILGEMYFKTGGSEKMRINISGNVGIGTTNPQRRLDVVGAHTTSTFRVYYPDLNVAGQDASVDIWASEPGVSYSGSGIGSNVNGQPYYGRTNPALGQTFLRFINGNMMFHTSTGDAINAERMRIDSSGNIGIGTSSPRTKVDIEAYTPFQSLSSAINSEATTPDQQIGGIDFRKHYALAIGASIRQLQAGGTSNYSNAHLAFYTNNGEVAFGSTPPERMRITSAGNVGIGTTSPSALLHLVPSSDDNAIRIGRNNGYVSFYNSAGSTRTGYIQFNSDSASRINVEIAQPLAFYTSASERMRIDANGLVGIGTSSPNTPLDIQTNGSAYGINVRNRSGDDYSNITFSQYNGTTYNASAGWASSRFRITTGGLGDAYERLTILSAGNVGIGTTSPTYKTHIEGTGADIFLTKNTTSTSFNRSFFYNNNNIGIQFLNFGSAYAFGTEFSVGVNGSVIQSNTTSAFAVGTSGAYPLILGTSGTERMRILSGGNVGIGTTSPAYKTDIVGNLRFSTGYLNSDNCFERVFSDAIVFANGTANLAADVILGNSNFWGYIEVEVTSTFNNQSSPGKLTKIFAAGVTPNNNIYANESRVSDAMGPVPNNVAIGDLSWDATNSRYRIPISHIVSTGNTYTVKVRMFTANASSSTGAKGVFDSISISSTYTLTALSRQYPYYNSKLSIGTSSASAVLTLQNESGAYGTSYPFKMLSYAGTNIFRSYMDGNWNYVNEVFQVGGNSCSYIISTNSSERMRITSAGNVGIGNTSPTSKLIVDYTTNGADGIVSRNLSTGTSAYAFVGAFANTGGIDLRSYPSTNPSFPSTSFIASSSTQTGGIIVSQAGANPISFWNNGSEKMRIASGGNIGIGTTSPSYPLHVSSQVSNVSIYADYDIVAYSDKSVKENIRPIDNALERVIESRGVLYDRIDSGEKDNIGFIAQELEVAFPELVVTNPDGTKAVKYQNAVAVLFEAVKEQQKQIDEIKRILNGLTN